MRRLLAIISVMLLSVATAATAQTMTGSGDLDTYTYNGSRARDYTVYVPQSYDGNTAVPMIFVLHGCAMDHNDARNLWNFDLIADQNNVIVVFPFVTSFSEMRNENCWGYWFDNHIREGGGGEVDDLYNMAKQVESNYNIDPDRRYITGLSSGGGMTVAAAIAYNEYWAAAAPAAGLAYGDWSSSVTADLFQDLQVHIDKINAELDSDRAIPMLVIQSSNDTVVMPRAMELIRDSHLSVFGPDLSSDASESCSAEGISCTLTTYNDANGNPLIKTMVYAGLAAKSASYGQGHYWTGDDENQDKWAKETGPSASQYIWNFFQPISMNGFGAPAGCENDTDAPATPTGLAPFDVHDDYAKLTVNANGEGDLKGYKIYKTDGSELTPFPSTSETITVTGLTPETTYNVYATAVDDCGNESAGSSSVNFTTTSLEYVAPSASGTCTEHYNAGRLDVNGYISCGNKHGYSTSVTYWQLEDGSWSDVDPNGGSGGGGGGGGGNADPGSWSTNSSLAGMEVHIYTPTTSTANGKRALMVALHGCAQSNEVVRDNWSWQDEADEYGMVIAAPMAPNGGVIAGCWDYYDSNHSRANPGRHDDNLINMTQTLLNDADLNIDPDQVYISGLSSGGGETFVMGCVAPELFAGIGINAGPAVGTSSGQIGSVAVTATQAANTCQGFADDGNSGSFATQITSVVHGTADGTVATGYAEVDAQAMANIYGASKNSGSNSIAGGGTEETWSDGSGVRVSKIMVSGLGHAWPAGSDSSGGAYTDHGTVDYPAFVTAFFFANNRRADFTGPTDDTPPGVPTNLAATGATTDSITMAWNDPGDADLDYYTLYKDGSVYTTTSTTSVTVTGLNADTSYDFQISATDTSGNESTKSAVVAASTQASGGGGGGDTTPPATPSGLSVSGATETSFNVDWNDNTESDLVGYEVYVNGSLVTTVQMSAYTVTGLSANTTYTVAIAAYDSSGNVSSQASVQGSTTAPQTCWTDTNANHHAAGRAIMNGTPPWENYSAAGSYQWLGYASDVKSLEETSAGYFVVVSSCP